MKRAFKQNIISIYGSEGKKWLKALPEIISKITKEYNLANLKPVNNLSYNYVLSGLQDSQPIILKLGLDVDGLKRESAALIAFEGFGAVQVFSENTGLLLLECAVPGVSLKSHFPEKDDDAINITANMIKRLHQAPIPSPNAFPHVKEWLAVLDSDLKIPAQTLQKARELRDQLLKTAAPDVLLHGDLHHDNILQNGNDWVVIDPKGVIGEPIFELAAYLSNPVPELLQEGNAKQIIAERIKLFSQNLGMSEQRINDWLYLKSVLCWAWSLEDNLDPGYWKQLIGIINK